MGCVDSQAYEELVQALVARHLRWAMEYERLVPSDVVDAIVSPEELGSAAVRAATILQQHYAKARSRCGRFSRL